MEDRKMKKCQCPERHNTGVCNYAGTETLIYKGEEIAICYDCKTLFVDEPETDTIAVYLL
jgi:hypothetical protein